MVTIAHVLSAPWTGSDTVSVSGRIKAVTDHGGAVFAALTDGGATLQLILERDRLDRSAFDEHHDPFCADLPVRQAHLGLSQFRGNAASGVPPS
jgi:lysyl-tRNA synthetase class II